MNFIYAHKLSFIVIIIILFGVITTQSQNKTTNEQNQDKNVQNDSVRLNSEKNKSMGYFNVTSLEVPEV
jgi:beta-lactamase regulating signal transducer with metallopeptidase domain